MLSISFICVGKMREAHYIAAFAEYEKRLGALCRFDLREIPEQRLSERPSAAEIDAALAKEGEAILRAVPKGAKLVALCIEGRQLSSEALAEQFSAFANGGASRLVFIVGGSYGLSYEVKSAADFRLSMSKMTFPHHLARVMLAEQVYRALMINSGSKYHK